MKDAIIISDIHIGSRVCQANLLTNFLDEIKDKTKRIIINGDLFDSFDSRVKKSHWKTLGAIRKISDDIEVVWVKGNHDTLTQTKTVSQMLGTHLYVKNYVFESGDKKILVVHGDKFDSFLTDYPILVTFADWMYWVCQKLHVAKFVKHGAKKYLRCHERVEKGAINFCKMRNCDIVCCGHVHYSDSKHPYYNSGCWTEETCSYLAVEDGKVTLELIEA